MKYSFLKKFFAVLLVTGFLVGGSGMVLAQTDSSGIAALQNQINQLLKIVSELQQKLDFMKKAPPQTDDVVNSFDYSPGVRDLPNFLTSAQDLQAVYVQLSSIPSVRQGMTDPAVKQIQNALKILGYLNIDTTTNYFGVATKNAVARLQTQVFGFPQSADSGIWGPASRAAVAKLASAQAGTNSQIAASSNNGQSQPTNTSTGVEQTSSCTASDIGFCLSISPASRVINQGDTTTFDVTVTPRGGFSGSVNLSLGNSDPYLVTNSSFLPSALITVSNVSSPKTQTITIDTNSSVLPNPNTTFRVDGYSVADPSKKAYQTANIDIRGGCNDNGASGLPPCGTLFPVTCIPSTKTVTVGEQAKFLASGGGSQLYWHTTGGNPSCKLNTQVPGGQYNNSCSNIGGVDINGNPIEDENYWMYDGTFTTKYSTPGNYEVFVESEGIKSPACRVTVVAAVQEPPVGPLSCKITNSPTTSYGTVNYDITGGTPQTSCTITCNPANPAGCPRYVNAVVGGGSGYGPLTQRTTVTINCNRPAGVTPGGQTVTAAQTSCSGMIGPTSGSGNSTSTPPGGNTTSTPPGGNSTSTPPGGNTTSTPPGGGTPPPTTTAPLTCAPANQNVYVGQVATITASGSVGPYTWSAANGNPSTGTGTSFTTSYSSAGTRSVTVRSATAIVGCAINVLDNPSAPPSSGGNTGGSSNTGGTGVSAGGDIAILGFPNGARIPVGFRGQFNWRVSVPNPTGSFVISLKKNGQTLKTIGSYSADRPCDPAYNAPYGEYCEVSFGGAELSDPNPNLSDADYGVAGIPGYQLELKWTNAGITKTATTGTFSLISSAYNYTIDPQAPTTGPVTFDYPKAEEHFGLIGDGHNLAWSFSPALDYTKFLFVREDGYTAGGGNAPKTKSVYGGFGVFNLTSNPSLLPPGRYKIRLFDSVGATFDSPTFIIESRVSSPTTNTGGTVATIGLNPSQTVFALPPGGYALPQLVLPSSLSNQTLQFTVTEPTLGLVPGFLSTRTGSNPAVFGVSVDPAMYQMPSAKVPVLQIGVGSTNTPGKIYRIKVGARTSSGGYVAETGEITVMVVPPTTASSNEQSSSLASLLTILQTMVTNLTQLVR